MGRKCGICKKEGHDRRTCPTHTNKKHAKEAAVGAAGFLGFSAIAVWAADQLPPATIERNTLQGMLRGMAFVSFMAGVVPMASIVVNELKEAYD